MYFLKSYVKKKRKKNDLTLVHIFFEFSKIQFEFVIVFEIMGGGRE